MPSATFSGLSAEQAKNAQTIISVGRQMGMSSRDIQIGIMTALQESSLRNLSYGHLDSVGLFQQRASWGSFKQRTDPRWSTSKFFSRLKSVSGRDRMPMWQAAQKVQISANGRLYDKWSGLAKRTFQEYDGSVSSGGSGTMQSRQALLPGVDRKDLSPFEQQTLEFRPRAESEIGNWQARMASFADPVLQARMSKDSPMGEVTDALAAEGREASGSAGAIGAASPGNIGAQSADKQVDFAGLTDMSIPELDGETASMFQDYLKSSGSPRTGQAGNGVSGMRADVLATAKKYIGVPYVFGGNSPSGFDCSSLVQYTLRQFGIDAPRLAYQQARWGEQTNLKNIKAGDLVFWGNSQRTQGNHIAFYLGNGMILEAPRPGLSVRVRKLGQWDEDDNAIGVKIPY